MIKEDELLKNLPKIIKEGKNINTEHIKLFYELLQKYSEKITNINNKQYKKWIVLYHKSDIDGQGIKIISELIKQENKDIEILYVPCGIRADEGFKSLKENLDNYDLAIIADLNFTEEYAEKVDKELDTSKIILLDHHKHALYLNKYDWAFVKSHDISNKLLSSGTMLLYILFKDLFSFDNNIYNIRNLVYYIAAHDTWFAHDNKTKELSKLLYEDYPEHLDLLFKSNKKQFVDTIVQNINNGIIIDEKSNIVIETTKNIVNNYCLLIYNNCKIIKTNNKTIAFCFTENYTSEIGNFILDKQPEIDYVIMAMPNVNTVSLRSRDDENGTDVSIIAMNNDGGGHKPAAGFSTNKEDINIFIKSLMDKYILSDLLDNKEIYNIKDFEYNKEENKFDINK